MFTKVKYISIGIAVCLLFGVGTYLSSNGFDYDNIYKNANVWYKVSSDELNPGEISALDMTEGYSKCDDAYIYIAVKVVNSDEIVMVVFPNGGQWYSDTVDTTSIEIQRQFGKLEEDLRNAK